MSCRRQHPHHHPEAVVERYRHADPIELGEPHSFGREVGVVDDVIVGERRALRVTRSAARELDVVGRSGIHRGRDPREGAGGASDARSPQVFEGNATGRGLGADAYEQL